MLTATDVAEFFDEMDERLLVPFDWVPNELLPDKKTYRIKDRFLVKFDGKMCRYSDINKCKIAFQGIFQDNVLFVYKCHELLEKLKKIADPDRYDYTTTTKGKTLSNKRTGTNTDRSTSSLDFMDKRRGALSGSVNKATLRKHYDPQKKVITVRKVLDRVEDEDAVMQYLDPDVKDLQQNYNRSETKNITNLKESFVGTIAETGLSDNSYMTIRSVSAINEAQALTVQIPRLVGEFLECFNPLFYV